MCNEGSVWSYGVLRARGLSRRTIRANVEAGSFIHVRRGVYAAADACDEVLDAAQHGGSLACESAARHAGLWTLSDGRVHVWMGDDGHENAHSGCACQPHWTTGRPGRRFRPATIIDVLCQVYACRGDEAFFTTLESARRQHRITRTQLRSLVSRLDSRGRDLVEFSRQDAESGLESLFRLRLRSLSARLRSQVAVTAVGRVDFLIDGWLIVELDGREGHTSADDRSKDLTRDAHAALWGYRTLRFTYAMVIHDWDLVETTVRAALAARD